MLRYQFFDETAAGVRSLARDDRRARVRARFFTFWAITQAAGDEGFTARWHHAVDFPGADYVQMARGEGGKEPPLACPPNQGFAAHLSTCCFISRAWPPIRTADAAARNRFVLGRTSTSR
jgi:hypothetical protein